MSESAPVKLLLVDDRPENLTALDALLRRSDVALLHARSGREALELLLVHDFALALVDVQMPELDGFELAELMRGSERTRHVPIIFVTAAASDRERVFQGYDAGGVDFLYKPLEPHVLQNKVDTFVALYRQRAQLAEKLASEQRLLAELRETLRMNEAFTAVLSHDLRSPLGAIMLTADSLSRRDDPVVKRAGERMKSVGKRMTRMVNELLDVARAKNGGIPVTPAPIDLADVMKASVDELAEQHRETQIDISVNGDAHGSWDADRLMQLITNLVSNAVQHADAHAVALSLDGTAEKSVQLAVENTGVLDAAVRPHLFEPFRTGTSARPGMGLGLYIVDQIARAHGGSVDVRCDGGATRFTVTLPRTS